MANDEMAWKHFELGNSYLSECNAQAIVELTKSLEYKHSDPYVIMATYGSLGYAYQFHKEYDKAIPWFTNYIGLLIKTNLKDDLVKAVTERGKCRFLTSDLDNSISDFELALQGEPTNQAIMELLNTAKKQRDARCHNNEISRKHFNLGSECFMEGDNATAIVEFNKAIDCEPTDQNLVFAIYGLLGSAYKYTGEYDKALIYLTKAIEINPQANVIMERGRVYIGKGDFSKSIEDFETVLRMDSTNSEVRELLAETYFQRGNTYSLNGQHDQSIADFDKTIELDPGHARAYVFRGLAYGYKGFLNRTIADLEYSLKLNPNVELANLAWEKLDEAVG